MGFIWWPEVELNHRHADFQSAALPTELSGHRDNLFYRIIKIKPKKLVLIWWDVLFGFL